MNYYFPEKVDLKHEGKDVQVKQVSCGLDHTLVVDQSGRLFAGGNNNKG